MKKILLVLWLSMPLLLNAQYGFHFEKSGNLLFRDWSAGNFFNSQISGANHLSLMVNNPYFIPNSFLCNIEYGQRLKKRSANLGLGYGLLTFDEFNIHLIKLNLSKDLGNFKIGGTCFLSWFDTGVFDDFDYDIGGINLWTSYQNEKSQALFLMQYVHPGTVLIEPNEMRIAFTHKLTDRIDLYGDLNHFLQRGFSAKIAVDLNINDQVSLGSGFALNGKEVFFSFIYNAGSRLRLRTNGSLSSPMGADLWADGLLKLN